MEVSHSLALTKVGTGQLTLSGTSSYSGGTTINGGTLHVAGSTYTGSSTSTVGTITINNGGILQVAGGGKLYPNLSADLSNAITINSGGDLVLNSWALGDSLRANCTSMPRILS